MNEKDKLSLVSNQYIENRDRILRYTFKDMNLSLENDEQVYIALFDIPMESGIVGFQTQSLGLVFGLNTHLYHGSGAYVVDLEKRPKVMEAMQSVLISCHQVIPNLELAEDFSFYNSKNVRVYLKTKNGVYFKELSDSKDKINQFLTSMMNYVLKSIKDSGGNDI